VADPIDVSSNGQHATAPEVQKAAWEPMRARAQAGRVPRLRRSLLWTGAAVMCTLMGLALIQGAQSPRPAPEAAKDPDLTAQRGHFLTGLPDKYSAIPPPAAAARPAEPVAATPPTPAPPAPPVPSAAPVAVAQAPPPPARPAPVAPPPKKEEPAKPRRWLAGQREGQVLAPPFGVPKGPPPELVERLAKAERIIEPATWAIPKDPLKTLYRSQVLTGQTLGAITSNIPGVIRILVTKDVTDKFGQGVVVVPAQTIVIAQQTGRPEYGDARLQIEVQQLELPTGEVAVLTGTAGDASGNHGLTGKVNNHWGQVIGAAGLSAILSLGARLPLGDTTSYQSTMPQQLADQFGNAMNRAGQGVVQRSLQVKPTITIPAGVPVTVQLTQNLSFQTKPVVATR
jgi:type IV secretory pathway VirB10-like protein